MTTKSTKSTKSTAARKPAARKVVTKATPVDRQATSYKAGEWVREAAVESGSFVSGFFKGLLGK